MAEAFVIYAQDAATSGVLDAVAARRFPHLYLRVYESDAFDREFVLEEHGLDVDRELHLLVVGPIVAANRAAGSVLADVLRGTTGDVVMEWTDSLVAERRGGVLRVSDAWRDDIQVPETTA
jgi:hypothetical protein